MKTIYYLLLFTIGIAACSTPNESSFEFDLSTVYNQINFDQPTIGQTSIYLRFDGSNFGASNSSINYSGDTLLVTLTSKSGNSYTFQEEITSGSTVFNLSSSYIDGHDIVKTSEWQLDGDSLRFSNGATFLQWNETLTIPLVVDENTPNASLRNWGTNNTNSTNTYLGISAGRINDFNFDDLTVSYLNNSANSSVFEIVCNRPFAIIRSSVFNESSLSGFGWDLQLGN